LEFIRLPRRRFLAHSALLAAGSLAAAAPAADPQPRFSLGFSLYGLPKLTLDDSLRLCADAGYDSVELALLPGYPTEPKQFDAAARRGLRQTLDRLGLRVAGFMENMPAAVDDAKHREHLERIKAAAELAHDLGVAAPLESVIGGKPGQWDELKTQMVDRLGDWAVAGERSRVVVCVKPHVGGALNQPADAVWLLRQIDSPWLRLVYDYSHYEHRGFDLAETIRELAPLAPFVHVKDRAADTSRVQFLLPGEGRIDYTQYARLLAATGYRGPVVVEVSAQIHGRPEYDPQTAVRQCHERLAAAFGGAE